MSKRRIAHRFPSILSGRPAAENALRHSPLTLSDARERTHSCGGYMMLIRFIDATDVNISRIYARPESMLSARTENKQQREENNGDKKFIILRYLIHENVQEISRGSKFRSFLMRLSQEMKLPKEKKKSLNLRLLSKS